MCSVCIVQEECLNHAMEELEQFGLWGGLTERERRNMRKANNGRSSQEGTRQEVSVIPGVGVKVITVRTASSIELRSA